MSRRRRREQLVRQLLAAQHQLASVVLDLEALEVTYHATPENHRTAAFTSTWNAIHKEFLAITVAVRSAAAYLGLLPGQAPDTNGLISKRDPAVLVDALWRIKEEFPLLVDPATQELHEDQAIIPVWDVGNGTAVVPSYLSGARPPEQRHHRGRGQ